MFAAATGLLYVPRAASALDATSAMRWGIIALARSLRVLVVNVRCVRGDRVGPFLVRCANVVVGVRIVLGEGRRSEDGAESDEDKKLFHGYSPVRHFCQPGVSSLFSFRFLIQRLPLRWR
jgi:hypothetical protein